MRAEMFGFLVAGMLWAQTPGDDAYAPLRLYQGSWRLTASEAGKAAKTDEIKNDCNRIGAYFACQQIVNGTLSDLVIFVPAKEPGRYYTQALLPDARATGRGELAIAGDHWTYSSEHEDEGKTVRHRIINVFSGKDHIHYERSESMDGVHWTVKSSGDEVRSGN